MAPIQLVATLAPSPGIALPLADTVPGLLKRLGSFADHAAVELEEDEARVIRACMRLAGAALPAVGLADSAFYSALVTLTGRVRLDGGACKAVLDAASYRVGASGAFASQRGAWFDAAHAPRLLRELSSLALVVRALREQAI